MSLCKGKQNAKYLQRPLPRSEGKTASQEINARFMLDIVNFRADSMALFFVNVFTRKVWAVAIKDKSAASVLKAGKALIGRLDEKPKVVWSDDDLGPCPRGSKNRGSATNKALLTQIKMYWRC